MSNVVRKAVDLRGGGLTFERKRKAIVKCE